MNRTVVSFAVGVMVSFTGLQTFAQAGNVFDTYVSVGNELVAEITNTNGKSARIPSLTQDLVRMGYEIMQISLKKYPECAEQFRQVQTLDSEMATSSFEALEAKFHDGDGLLPAPTHCYQPRSMVVHPYMALALLRVGKPGAPSELEEVIRRAPKLKARLG